MSDTHGKLIAVAGALGVALLLRHHWRASRLCLELAALVPQPTEAEWDELRQLPDEAAPAGELRSLAALGRVLEFGAKKTRSRPPQEAGVPPEERSARLAEHLAAHGRHYAAWLRGERQDPDTGASPLVHAAARLLLAADLEIP